MAKEFEIKITTDDPELHAKIADIYKEYCDKKNESAENLDYHTTMNTDVVEEKIVKKEYNVGDTVELEIGGETITAYVAGVDFEPDIKDHHYTLIANFGESEMGNSALHGYNGAKTMQNFLDSKVEDLKKAVSKLGYELVERDVFLSSSIEESDREDRYFKVSEYAYTKKYLMLLSEVEVFGKKDYSDEYEIHDTKYPIFENKDINNLFRRASLWLRGVHSAASFCLAYGDGLPDTYSASASLAAVALFIIR